MTTVAARLALLSLVSFAPVFVGSAGCTLFSGWGDLQDGTPTTADAAPGTSPGTGDSGADSADGQSSPRLPGSDSGASPDSSSSTPDASSVLLTIECGSTRCALGDQCCAGVVTEPSVCQATTLACSPASTPMSCSDSSQCTVLLGHAAQCCQNAGGAIPTVSCVTTCTGTGNVVCDPTLVSPGCPAGKVCQSSEEFGYDTCQ